MDSDDKEGKGDKRGMNRCKRYQAKEIMTWDLKNFEHR